jgi:CO/xanthine dehydrogenase FAD-binding subunit
MMILEYQRPSKIEDVLSLLARTDPPTIPIGGGTALERFSTRSVAVVDLQSMGLNTVQRRGNALQMGATLTLQNLADTLDKEKLANLAGLIQAIAREGTYNLRQVGTVAGALVAASGRSPFATAMLALDASLKLQPGDEQVGLGDLLPMRLERLSHRLVTLITIPLNVKLAYEYVARSPADFPIICAAVSVWPSGRTRLALGGFGSSPVLAFDGSEAEGVEIAARAAYSQAGDEWASAEYRQEIAGVLAKRCVNQLTEIKA